MNSMTIKILRHFTTPDEQNAVSLKQFLDIASIFMIIE